MLLPAIAVYNLRLQECYSQESSATISLAAKTITLDLVPLEGATCDFPAGILVQLFFLQATLNTAQIFTDFSFSTTRELTINFDCDATSCPQYDAAEYLEFRMDSVQLTTELAVGAVLNDRLRIDECSSALCVLVMIPNTDPALSQILVMVQPTCLKLQQMNISAIAMDSMMHDNTETGFRMEGANMGFLNNGFINIMVNEPEYYATIVIQSAKHSSLVLEGWINGIFVSEILYPSIMEIQNQKTYISGWTVKLSSQDIYIENVPGPDYADLQDLFASGEFTHMKASIIITENAIITYELVVTLNPIVIRSGGTLLCDDADNPQFCREVLQEFEGYDSQQTFVIPTLQYYKNKDITHVETFFVIGPALTTSCFNSADSHATPENVKIVLKKRANASSCKLATNGSTIIQLAYFETKDGRIEASKDTVITVLTKVMDFNADIVEINIPSDKKTFELLKTEFSKAFSMELAFLRFDPVTEEMELIDNANIADFQYSDNERVEVMNIALVAGFTTAAIAFSLIEQFAYTALKKRRKTKLHRKPDALDDM